MFEAIPEGIREAVLDRIDAVEKEFAVKVVYACESGSRAWRFASADSDYDVRFIYVNRPEWYVSVESLRDVIELPIDGDLDVNGWDLRKALGLLRKSNPPLLEWLDSPLVYREVTPIASWMREIVQNHYSSRACWHHYLHMAEGNFRHCLQGDEVFRKKHLYVLRPVLAILWIERGLGVVPTPFQTAVDAVVDDPGVRAAIDRLLEAKRAGKELDSGPRIPAIAEFLEKELERLTNHGGEVVGNNAPRKVLNKVLREGISTAWRQDA